MAYESAVVVSVLGPALIFTLLAYIFPESKGTFKFFFSWLALLFSSATTFMGYAIAELGGYTQISQLLLGLAVILMIVATAWALIFVLGVTINYINDLRHVDKPDTSGDYERHYS